MFSRPQVKPDWALADLHQLIPYSHKTSADDEIGVEFELEGPGVLNVAMKFNEEVPGKAPLWKYHQDLSLNKTGAEFVLARPMHRDLVKEAVEELYYELGKHATIQLSRRCSTHIHQNFQHRSVNQTYLYLVLHYVLEEAMFKAISPDRYGNNFCVPLVLSDAISEDLIGWLYANKFKKVQINSNNKTKYRAMNFDCLLNYGSLEDRMMGGCSNPKDFFTWLDVKLELYDFAKNNERLAPDFFLQQFSGKGFQLFIEEMFPKTWAFIKNVPNIDALLNRGVFAAQDIAYAVDWSCVMTGTKPAKVRKSDPSIKPSLNVGTLSSFSNAAHALLSQGSDIYEDA